MPLDTRTKVGILRGGAGKNYNSSLQRGSDVIAIIFENLSDKYKPVDVFVDNNDIWHVNGILVRPADLLYKVDVVWDTTNRHDLYNIVNNLSIPTVGPSSFLKALENDRESLRKHVKDIGVNTTRSILLPVYQKDFDGDKEKYILTKAKEVWNKFGAPWIVKSYTPDSNMAIHLAKTFDELVDSISDGVSHGNSILIEEFISGKVGSVHSVLGFRGEDVYVFPPSELKDPDKANLTSIIKNMHKHLDARHYLKSDFVLHPKLGFYITNIESSLDTRVNSHFRQSCEYVGAEIHHIIDHFIEKTLNK